jgi:hypothetical protein
MKKTIILFCVTCLWSCTTVWEKPVSKDSLSEISTEISAMDSLSSGKKKFINEMMTMAVNLSALAPDQSALPTFRAMFDMHSHQYDSMATVYKTALATNDKLKNYVVSLDDAVAYGTEDHSTLFMKLTVNNQFNKDVHYMIVQYKLVNEYDTEHFSGKVKVTSENIKGNTVEFGVENKYGKMTTYFWSEAPADDEKRKAILMKDLKVEILGIVFKDKSEVTFQNTNWEYL